MNPSDRWSGVYGGVVKVKQKRLKVVRNYFPLLKIPVALCLYNIILLYDLVTSVSVISRILSGGNHITHNF